MAICDCTPPLFCSYTRTRVRCFRRCVEKSPMEKPQEADTEAGKAEQKDEKEEEYEPVTGGAYNVSTNAVRPLAIATRYYGPNNTNNRRFYRSSTYNVPVRPANEWTRVTNEERRSSDKPQQQQQQQQDSVSDAALKRDGRQQSRRRSPTDDDTRPVGPLLSNKCIYVQINSC